MKINWFLLILFFAFILVCGCTGNFQDERFKQLVQNVTKDFQGQDELIIKPYQGLTSAKLYQYKSAAVSAISAAKSMTLSDKSAKARGIFIEGMNNTITAVDALEKAGKLTGTDEPVPLESVSGYFITTQRDLDDTCSLIGIEPDKSS